MKLISPRFCVAIVWLAAGEAGATPQALPAPQVFSPGVISGPSNDGAPTISPDGRVLLFERAYARWAVIFESRLADGEWTTPVVASFSGPSSDQQPSFSPDGAYVVYASARTRPSRSGNDAREVFTHLWRADRVGSGWGRPIPLPDTVNISDRVYKPSIANNGDLYFMAATEIRPDGPAWRLYRAARRGDGYAPAEALSFSDGTYPDVDPWIAPDQSFLIFSSRGRRNAADRSERLYLVTREGTGWGPVTPLRYEGDDWGADDGEAQVSPDGATLFFTSGRSAPFDRTWSRQDMMRDVALKEAWDNSNSNVWTLPLVGLLEANGIGIRPPRRSAQPVR